MHYVIGLVLMTTMVLSSPLLSDEDLKKMSDQDLKSEITRLLIADEGKNAKKEDNNGYVIDIKPVENECMDLYPYCDILMSEEGLQCIDENKMTTMCAKTCRVCSIPAVPVSNCSETEFGCCKDEHTTKTDSKGANCPKCRDISEHCNAGSLEDCNKIDFVGTWMRNNCPKSCEVCSDEGEESKCKDSEEFGKHCENWKSEELCHLVPDLMKKECQKTCGFC